MMSQDLKSIFYNILGGIIVSILTTILIYLRHKCRHFHLQRLLGFILKPEIDAKIVYGQLTLPPVHNTNGQLISHPFVKPPRNGGALPLQGTYSITHPISECEVRASSYLTSMLSSPGNTQPNVISDTDANDLLDCNLFTLGGPGSNYKTADILASPANIFIRMSHNGFSLHSGEALPFVCDQTTDYGFILRITPNQFPKRSWIACAGLGEWGTSGSAWFLSNKWRQLLRTIYPFAYYIGFMPIPDFVAIVKVTRGQDQSSDIVALYRRSGKKLKNVK